MDPSLLLVCITLTVSTVSSQCIPSTIGDGECNEECLTPENLYDAGMGFVFCLVVY